MSRNEAPRQGFAADYIQVHERIAAFYEKFPDGSLQSEMVELTDNRVVMRAYAYRIPDDVRPGIGYSSLEIPGRTPYTRGSEIENCETSAWGRAIAALGFEVKRGIATQEEIRNKQEPPANGRRPTPIRSATSVPEPDDEDVAALHNGNGHSDEPWDYNRFREACKHIAGKKPELKDVVGAGVRLFPGKDLELHEPKMWSLSDREWRQLAVVLGAPET